MGIKKTNNAPAISFHIFEVLLTSFLNPTYENTVTLKQTLGWALQAREIHQALNSSDSNPMKSIILTMLETLMKMLCN
jgi:hypothetical protein